MNEIVTRMVDTQMLLFLYMLCGFTVSRLNLIRDSNRSALVRLLMDVAMPMMVLHTKTAAKGRMARMKWGRSSAGRGSGIL